MAKVRLNSKQIKDWKSFHLLCKSKFGFPDFYGTNMNAWIDCLSCLDNEEEDRMSRFTLEKGELLHIEISDTEDFNSRLPEIFDALVECSAFVNRRYVDDGKPPVLSLLFL
ncbi:MAG: barstar family protein [Acidobacteriota bacterium]|nr:barstar family protein [Acidobacteriota bacterium]